MTSAASLLMMGVRPLGSLLGGLALSTQTFASGLAAGQTVATILGKRAGSTLTISPADGVFVLNAGQTQVLRGLSPVSSDTLVYDIVETLPGALNSPRHTTFTFVVSAPVTKLAPGSGWTGSPDPSLAPTQATRTGGFVPGNLLTADMRAVTTEEAWVIDAKQGSCSGVTAVIEGGTPVTVTTPGFHTVATPNGPAQVYGYGFTPDIAALTAAHPGGRFAVYFTKHSSKANIADHVIGPYYFDACLPTTDLDATTPTTVGTTYEFDRKITIDQTAADAADVAGVAYNDPVKALAWLTTTAGLAASQRPVLYCVSSGNIPFWASVGTSGGAGLGYAPAGYSNNRARTSWTVIKAKPGVTVVVGDGSRRRVSGIGYDGLEFRGANVRVDLNAIDPGGSPFRFSSAGNQMLRFNGCEYFAGDNSTHIFDATHGRYLGGGSGAGTTYDGQVFQSQPITSALIPVPRFNLYYEFVNAHDLPQYGLSFAKLVVGCTLTTVSSSAMENNWGSVHGNVITGCDAQAAAADCRTFKPALKLKAPTGWYAAITGGNSSTSRHFQIYDGSGTSQFDMLLSTTLPAVTSTTGTTTKVADLVSAINTALGASGVTATEVVQNRMASYLTFTQTSLPETHVSLNPTSDTVFSTFIDAHADGVVYHTADLFNNMCITMNRFLRHAASHISFSYDGKTAGTRMHVQDVNVEWNEFFDISVTVYGLSYSGSYNQAVCSNLTFEHFSEYGGAFSWSRNATDPTDGYPNYFTGDAQCVWSSIACQGLNYGTPYVAGGATVPATPVDPTIVVDHIASIAALPSQGALSQPPPHSTQLGATMDQIYAGPISGTKVTATDFDFSPAGSYLQADDGSWIGSRIPGNRWNGAYY